MRYTFNDCVLDTERRELRRADEPVRLRPKVFQLLAYLIAHRDRVISKQELFEQLWPQRVVGDATLNSCVMELRRAIGDRGELQHTIKTLHGQGYRLVASVVEQPHPAPDAEPEVDPGEAPTDHNPVVDAPTLDESHELPVGGQRSDEPRGVSDGDPESARGACCAPLPGFVAPVPAVLFPDRRRRMAAGSDHDEQGDSFQSPKPVAFR